MSEHSSGSGAVPPMLAAAIAPLRALSMPWALDRCHPGHPWRAAL